MSSITSMTLRPLGASGLMVTPVGLGMAALGRPGYMTLGHSDDLDGDYTVSAMETHAHTVLDAAWAAGVRYFDAARSYGRAEAFLGSWLEVRKSALASASSNVTIGSKWGYTYTAGWQVQAAEHEVKDLSLPVLERQWNETQALLPGCVDLYQIHSATRESGVLEDVAVLRKLARLKEAGTQVGLTLSGPDQAATLARALEVFIDGLPLFTVVQATWNVLERSAGDALAAAHAAGLGVIVKEAVANGRLTPRNDNPAFAHTMAVLVHQATRLHCTVDALALAAVLAQPWADVVLSGAATAEQVRSNVKALDVAWDEESDTALASLAEPADAYWKTRARLQWN